MKKKVGIITFHSSLNCGSMLQAYALQQVIDSFDGYQSKIIDFETSAQRRFYSTLVFPKNIKEFLRNIIFLFGYSKIYRQKNDYEQFKNTCFRLTDSHFSESKLLSEKLGFDVYVSGSDQIWNTLCLDFDDAYFLNFVSSKKKIAYATSMAANNIIGQGRKLEEKYKNYILDYDAVSVREFNSKIWLETLTERHIDIAADPSLVINESEWFRLSDKVKAPEEPYVFYYSMWYTNEKNCLIQRYARMNNLTVYVIDAKEYYRRMLWKFGFKLFTHSGPFAFLSLMKNADMIFTSSFHGTVFSAIFKKKFWYLATLNSNPDDDRASFILKQLNLEDRMLFVEKLQDFWNYEIMYDTKKVQNKIVSLRKHSIDWLYKSLIG